jgi:asparagine synthase (glutamine-hydrolysing)
VCGIVGIFDPERGGSEQELLAMLGEIRHRGPDGVGLYSDGEFAMAAARLAVVDIDGGDQPIGSEDGRYWVVQNGEIYNHPELRTELEQLGHTFATECDTEVIVHAYEQWGPACLDRFNGDFAFSIWDRLEREAFVARDRFGVRPLFFTQLGRRFAFASEAKALLRMTGARRTLDAANVAAALVTWSLPLAGSAFTGISQLEPAHWARIGPRGIIELRRWWDLDFTARPTSTAAAAGERLAELEHLLDDAVRIRLRSDVPVGVYLSGGLDSSVIAALTAAHAPRVSAFAVGFADRAFDESGEQDEAAAAIGLSLTRLRPTSAEIGSAFAAAIELAEQPSLRTAPAPLLLLSRTVREAGVRVILTGEGADELFGGYDIFLEDKVRRFWARDATSPSRPRLLTRLYPYLVRRPASSGALLHSFYGRGLDHIADPLYSHRIRFGNAARLLALLSPDFRAEAAARGAPSEWITHGLPARFADFSATGRAQYLEIRSFLEGYLLHAQGDRMLMGNSVEGRFPYLDHRVAEFAAALPDDLRVRGLTTKVLLRRLASRRLPTAVARRPKQPYRAPILASLLAPGASSWIRELLSEESLRRANILAPGVVRALVDKCDQRIDTGVGESEEMALAAAVSLMVLHDGFHGGVSRPQPLRASRVVRGARVVASLEAV